MPEQITEDIKHVVNEPTAPDDLPPAGLWEKTKAPRRPWLLEPMIDYDKLDNKSKLLKKIRQTPMDEETLEGETKPATHAGYLNELANRLQNNPEDKDALNELIYVVYTDESDTEAITIPQVIADAQALAALPMHQTAIDHEAPADEPATAQEPPQEECTPEDVARVVKEILAEDAAAQAADIPEAERAAVPEHNPEPEQQIPT